MILPEKSASGKRVQETICFSDETIRYFPVFVEDEIQHFPVRIAKEIESDPELLRIIDAYVGKLCISEGKNSPPQQKDSE